MDVTTERNGTLKSSQLKVLNEEQSHKVFSPSLKGYKYGKSDMKNGSRGVGNLIMT